MVAPQIKRSMTYGFDAQRTKIPQKVKRLKGVSKDKDDGEVDLRVSARSRPKRKPKKPELLGSWVTR